MGCAKGGVYGGHTERQTSDRTKEQKPGPERDPEARKNSNANTVKSQH